MLKITVKNVRKFEKLLEKNRKKLLERVVNITVLNDKDY